MILIRDPQNGELQAVFDAEGHDGWTVIGEIPDDVPPDVAMVDASGAIVADMTVLRQRKWIAIRAIRDAKLPVITIAGVGVFDADDTSRSNMLGKLQSFALLGANAPATVTWKLHDNSFVTLARADFESACLQVLAAIEAIYQASFTLEAQVNAAGDTATLNAIDINSGWPQ